MINQDRLYSFIGEQLKSHREKQGLTQGDLAGLVRLERTSITNIEGGKQKLPIHVLYGVCKALSIAPSDVLPRIEDVLEEPKLERVSMGDFTAVLPLGIARLVTGEGI